jgi:16S rRNA C967 or C1407 C5-methylase (RsmB/RsmF family)
MKWKFSLAMLERVASEQRVIFEQALSYVKPGGHIVYSTCSVLKRENHEQCEHFLKTYPLEKKEQFESFPETGKMDGFFAVTFQRK